MRSTFSYLPKREVENWALPSDRRLCQLRKGTNVIEYQHCFLPISVQLFLALSFPDVLRLPIWFQGFLKRLLDYIFIKLLFCGGRESEASYSAILLTSIPYVLSFDFYEIMR